MTGPEFKSGSLIPKSTLLSIMPCSYIDMSLRLKAPQVFWFYLSLEVVGGYNHGGVKGRKRGTVAGWYAKSKVSSLAGLGRTEKA